MGHSTFTLTEDIFGGYINPDVSDPAGMARRMAASPENGDNVVSRQRRKA